MSRNPTATPLKSVSASFALSTNAAAYADYLAPSASLDRPSPRGSKKEMTLPELTETLIEPDPHEPETTMLELDELWSFVLKRARQALDLARLVSGDPSSRRLCHWRAARTLLVKSCGSASLLSIALDIALATSRKLTLWSSPPSSIQQQAKRPALARTSKDGTTLCGRGSVALSESRYLFLSLMPCTNCVYVSSCMITTYHWLSLLCLSHYRIIK
jgi:hypothetical protein